MNKLLDELIRMSGLWERGIRRTSFIKTYVIKAYRSGMSADEFTLIAGLSAETIGKYLTMDTEQLSPILEWWNDRDKRKQQRIRQLRKMRKFML